MPLARIAEVVMVACVVASPVVAEAGGERRLVERVRQDVTPLPQAGVLMLSYAATVEKVRRSVVTVLVSMPPEAAIDGGHEDAAAGTDFDLFPRGERGEEDDEEEPQSSGSGLVLTADGLVVTNAHVIEGARTVKVRLCEAEEELPAVVVGLDTGTDIALLRIAEKALEPAVLADSSRTRPGDVVLALGSPYGLEQTITQGIISATGRGTLGLRQGGMEDFLQTDAAINPGNSGGPLVDGLGRVVGLNTARYRGINIGFAVRSNLMLKVAGDLLQHGCVVRGHLGIQIRDLTAALRQEWKLPPQMRGVMVAAVEADQPAARAGFRTGDVVRAVNGRRVENGARFRLSLASQLPGEKAVFTLLRQGKEQELTAVLVEPPELAARRQRETEKTAEWLPGLHVAEISHAWRQRLRLPPEAAGLVVVRAYATAVAGGSAGGATGAPPLLEEGAQILAINGTEVRTLEEAGGRLEQLKQTAVLLIKVRAAGKERLVAIPRGKA